jgi:hypothetical protein
MRQLCHVAFLTLACVGLIWGQSEQEALKRIAELEARLARAEALIEQLLARSASPTPAPVIEELTAKPAAVPAPEVIASQTPPVRQTMPQELLPNLGLIGAVASFSAGIHSGPYATSRGDYLGGSVALPLLRAPGGQLLYEFSAGLTRSSGNLRVRSNVAQVANLAVLGAAGLNDALIGAGAAPFPVDVDTRSRVDLLQVVPFGLRYQARGLDRWRLRPYLAAGFGLYVTLSTQTTLTGLRPNATLPPELTRALNGLFGNGAPFGGALIGGQITAARELTALGLPSGQGGLSPGMQTGGGIEWRIRPRFSLGADIRWNRLSNGISFFTVAPRSSFHF